MDGSNEMHNFTPSTDTAPDFRDALGRFATGVTVITALTDDGQPIGITANSFASVSLDPALVLWSPAKASSRYEIFKNAQHFAIHVLNADQANVCKAFVKDGAAFDGLDTLINDDGVTLINGCLARFECTQDAVHDAGDHSIIVGRVSRAAVGFGQPLLFASGQFGQFVGA